MTIDRTNTESTSTSTEAATVEAVVDAVRQSQDKLDRAAERLQCKLSSLLQQQQQQQQKEEEEEEKKASVVVVRSLPCTSLQETRGYRCKCSFQIIMVTTQMDHLNPQGKYYYHYQYALRERQQPVVIDSFPIANRRIQTLMTVFRDDILNYHNHNHHHHHHHGHHNHHGFVALSQHLTSCTFSTSWNEQDVILTLHYHYDKPLKMHQQYQQKQYQQEWREQARQACELLQLRQINGRSKGILLSETSFTSSTTTTQQQQQVKSDDESGNDKHDGQDKNAIESISSTNNNTLRDTIYLIQRKGDYNSVNGDTIDWQVTLVKQPQQQQQQAAATTTTTTTQTVSTSTSSCNDQTKVVVIPVIYHKPETAFFHPNPRAMTQALQWMLQRLQSIILTTTTTTMSSQSSSPSSPPSSQLSLLELYCGCGAHTVALAKTGMFSTITAVELDARLVQACRHNVRINQVESIVNNIQQCDAGQFAQTKQRRQPQQQQQQPISSLPLLFDVLLVDPPKQGLDQAVCDMALQQQSQQHQQNQHQQRRRHFEHILYISCGHQALLRDLERLSKHYRVVDCLQLDLFPGTYSIETLVHLQHCNN
jgi:tRNA/tmRNA/rRNA uracil-C5-methylase (TrmA/RlmC/RlmD family)